LDGFRVSLVAGIQYDTLHTNRVGRRSAQSAPENEWQNSSTVRLEDFDDIDYQDMTVNKDPQAKRLA